MNPRPSTAVRAGLLMVRPVSLLSPGSKSDGQKSPSDSVFLRMDEIPYIREDRPESQEDSGEDPHRVMVHI